MSVGLMSVHQIKVGRLFASALRHAVLIAVAVGALAPLYVMVTGSVKTQEQFLASPWGLPLSVNLAGWATALSDRLTGWFLNSVIITLSSVVGVVTLSAMASWGLVRHQFLGRNAFLSIVVSLMVVPPVVLLVPLFRLGVALGWMSTYQLVILVYVAIMMPFTMYLLFSFFATIPPALREAAEIDGASEWIVFAKIVVPVSLPSLATAALVNFLWVWNELLLALVLLQDDKMKTLMVGVTSFQGRFFLSVPTLMAGMTLVTLPLLVAYAFGQKGFIKGLSAGGLKGE
jgi:ABC-type glycerol-3-phosphate transport system permease component